MIFSDFSEDRISHDAAHTMKVGFVYKPKFYIFSSILKHNSSVGVFTFLFAATIRNVYQTSRRRAVIVTQYLTF